MKILYLHQYFNTPSMAGGTRSYEMARRFVQWGHEVHIITSERTGTQKGIWRETEEDGIHVHWTPVLYSNALSYRGRKKAFIAFAYRAGQKAVEIGGDVVFATSTPLTIALPAVYAKKKLRVPMVFEVRDLWPELPIAIGAIKNPLLIAAARQLEKYAYKNADKIVALSPGMKKGITRTGCPEEKIAVIPNSCDIDLFDVPKERGLEIRNQFEWLGDRPLVIYIGTFGKINGVGYLVRLAAEVGKHDPEVRFVAIGDGKEWHEVETLAHDLGVLNSNFFMFHQIPKKDTPSWFSAATISTSLFIDLPEMWNNSANKFFDSLAAGKPVAINYQGWQADLIRQFRNGLLLSSKNIPEAALLIKKSLTNKKEIKQMSMSSKDLASASFSRDSLATDLLQTLEEVNETKNPIGKGKIVHLTSVHSATDTRIFHREVLSLHRYGFSVTLIAPENLNGDLKQIRFIGVKKHSSRLLRRTFTVFNVLKKAISEEGEIYHFHDPELIPACLFLKFCKNTKVIYDMHEFYSEITDSKALLGPIIRKLKNYFLEKFPVRWFDRTVYPTESLRKAVVAKENTLTLIAFPSKNEVEKIITSDKGNPQKESDVIFVGTISPFRMAFLIDVLAYIVEIYPEIKWLNVGTSDQTIAWVRKQKIWDKIRNNITFIPRCSRENVIEYIKNSKIGFNHHPFEKRFLVSIPIKIFEYMAAGIPVVSTALPEIAQLCRDKEEIILLDSQDPKLYAIEIIRLLGNKFKREEIGRSAQNLLRTKLNWEQTEEKKLIKMYEELLCQ